MYMRIIDDMWRIQPSPIAPPVAPPKEGRTSILNLIGYIGRVQGYMRMHTIMLLSIMLLLWKFILYGLSIPKRKEEKDERKEKKRRKEERRQESVSMVVLCYHHRDSLLCRCEYYVLQ